MRWPIWETKSKESHDRDHKDVWSAISGINAEIDKIRSAIGDLKTSQSNSTPSGLLSRLEDLELWRGKVHKLLCEVKPTGEEKLSKQGRGFAALYGR